jgi:hypothetical protein
MNDNFKKWIKLQENDQTFKLKISNKNLNNAKDFKYTLLKQFLLNKNILKIENNFNKKCIFKKVDLNILGYKFLNRKINLIELLDKEKTANYFIDLKDSIRYKFQLLTIEKLNLCNIFLNFKEEWEKFKDIIINNKSLLFEDLDSLNNRKIITSNILNKILDLQKKKPWNLIFDNYNLNIWNPAYSKLWNVDVIEHLSYEALFKFLKYILKIYNNNLNLNQFLYIINFLITLFHKMEFHHIEDKINITKSKNIDNLINLYNSTNFNKYLNRNSIEFINLPNFCSPPLNLSYMINRDGEYNSNNKFIGHKKNIYFDKYSENSIFRTLDKFKGLSKFNKLNNFNTLLKEKFRIPELILYELALNYFKKKETYWPFKNVCAFTRKILKKETDWRNDITCPLLRPSDLFKLQLILSMFKFHKQRIEFLKKFINVNFNKTNRYLLDQWLMDNDYLLINKKKYKTFSEYKRINKK